MLLIRESKLTDLNSILILFKQLWPNKALREDKLKEIFVEGRRSISNRYLSAEKDEKMVGFCAINFK